MKPVIHLSLNALIYIINIFFRKVTDVDEMFKEICVHIKESSNNGIIIPMITVFPERQPNGKDIVRVWNPQLISYACYTTDDPKAVIGDRGNLQFTQVTIKITQQHVVF